MSHGQSGVNIARLCQIEVMMQNVLDREPEDTAARLRLAWCLLGKAFHRAGEDAISNTKSDSTEGAEQLLQRCLHHATIITQVSVRVQERQQADSLRALVEMAGGYAALEKSSEEEDTILQEILTRLRGTQESSPATEYGLAASSDARTRSSRRTL